MGQTGEGNRTIQIDALTDVQLVPTEHDVESVSAAPPPLPRRTPAPSRARVIGLIALASLAGLVLALLAVHFLFPTIFPAPPPASAPPASAPTVRRVTLDEELVIHAGDTTP